MVTPRIFITLTLWSRGISAGSGTLCFRLRSTKMISWLFAKLSWDPYAVRTLEGVAYSSYCNTSEWFWWDWSLSQWPTGFLRCYDAVAWVIWPVKIVSEMTYKVSSGTLSLYSLTLTQATYRLYTARKLCCTKGGTANMDLRGWANRHCLARGTGSVNNWRDRVLIFESLVGETAGLAYLGMQCWPV